MLLNIWASLAVIALHIKSQTIDCLRSLAADCFSALHVFLSYSPGNPAGSNSAFLTLCIIATGYSTQTFWQLLSQAITCDINVHTASRFLSKLFLKQMRRLLNGVCCCVCTGSKTSSLHIQQPLTMTTASVSISLVSTKCCHSKQCWQSLALIGAQISCHHDEVLLQQGTLSRELTDL